MERVSQASGGVHHSRNSQKKHQPSDEGVASPDLNPEEASEQRQSEHGDDELTLEHVRKKKTEGGLIEAVLLLDDEG